VPVDYSIPFTKILEPYRYVANGIDEKKFPPYSRTTILPRTGLVTFPEEISIEEAKKTIEYFGLSYLNFRETAASLNVCTMRYDLPIAIDVIADSIQMDGLTLIPRFYIDFRGREIQMLIQNKLTDWGVYYPVLIPF
jgi:hypothetical protein